MQNVNRKQKRCSYKDDGYKSGKNKIENNKIIWLLEEEEMREREMRKK